METYYSEEMRRDMIELSNRHVLWKVENYDEGLANILIGCYMHNFREKYSTSLYLCGRSGRHVCVENTPENRRRVYNMTRTVHYMQNNFIAHFSPTHHG